jgi:RNA polymerase sigma factor (sigma-70 family)
VGTATAQIRGPKGFRASKRLLALAGDDRLVAEIRRGNEAAFEVAYERHYRALLSFCRHMLGSRESGEEALQHTFAAAWADLQRSDRPVKLKPWLYTIARNRCLSLLRAQRPETTELEDPPATDGLAEEVSRRADLRALLADLRELSEDQRAALVLSELDGFSHADIAAVIGRQESDVKALVFRARSTLADWRAARETPCEEIREQLAVLTRGALRRRPIRRHLESCPGCRAFRDEMRAQRRMMAAILPVVPTVGLKQGVLAAVGLGGASAGGAAATGGAAAAGAGAATAGSIGTVTIAKVAVVVVAVGSAGAGGERLLNRDDPRAVPAPAAAPSSSGPGRAVAPPVSGSRASQGAGHVRAGRARREAKSRGGHPVRSHGNARRGGPSNRATAPGRVKQDTSPPRAGLKRNHRGARAKPKKLASAPAKRAKPKLPKARSDAGRPLPREPKPVELETP